MKAFLLPWLWVFAIASIGFAQNDAVVPGDNLVVEGIPKIAAALAEEVRPYTEFRGAGMNDWHPTKREVLIHTRFADTVQIHQVKFPGGARTQLTFFKDQAWEALFEPTKGNYFVFAKDTGGTEQYQKYRFDFATGAKTLLTDGKSRNTSGIWSNAGDRFIYASTRRNGQDVDLWSLDPARPETDKILAELKGGGWEPLDVSTDDRQLLVGEGISANESYIWIFDLNSGERNLLTPKGGEGKVAYGGAQF